MNGELKTLILDGTNGLCTECGGAEAQEVGGLCEACTRTIMTILRTLKMREDERLTFRPNPR